MLNEDQCWNAVLNRDALMDGQFFYGVTTTGIYCRPSCPTPRQALRKNVQFYTTQQAAEAAGLRPCKRCRPDDLKSEKAADRVTELCRYIEAHADESITLEKLSSKFHLSPSHLQRQFKTRTGITPKQYQEYYRIGSLRSLLKQNHHISDAIYSSGYGSTSRVYEKVSTNLGMTPKQYQAGGKDVTISYATLKTSLGLLMLAATDRGLCFVQFGDTDSTLIQQLNDEFPHATRLPMATTMKPIFSEWIIALRAHIKGESPSPNLPLDIYGTAFQIKVWRYLQSIPYGEVKSYSEIAKALKQPKAARAVASACAKNRIALLIPCHRVIRSDGSLAGYRWGLERKRALLEKEQATDNI